jgi:hypothetical protein
MFGFALALIASSMAVEATGMEPQLRVVRQAAANRGWPITCVGHAGEEGVVRVGIPPGTSREAVDGFIDALTPVASSVGNLGVDPSKQSCDHEAVNDGDTTPQRALAFGDAQTLYALQSIARECGYLRAYIRPRSAADDKVFFAWSVSPPNQTLDHTLDSGDDEPSRYGLACAS